MGSRNSFGWVLATVIALLAVPATASAGQVKAGAWVEDASWHVGAAAGQYASDGTFASQDGADPHSQSKRRVPSYGIQTRLTARALVVQGADGRKMAIVKNDLYIPQDLLWRRTAQILESKGIGIGRDNLTMPVSHSHSSPFYSSTGWGVWAFQDVFDFRFFEYYAQAMARAVERANARLVPVKVGASVSQYSAIRRNVPGPALADDGTPAGFPDDYGDSDLIVVRFDALDGNTVANLVNYSVHPETLAGNDLISADFLGPLERMTDRATGGVTIYTQGAVGSAEPEDGRWTNPRERSFFYHKQYAQNEFMARGIASQVMDTYKDIENGTPEAPDRFVPFRSDFANNEVAFVDRWFPGPASHPYPGVSSCRTDNALQGDPRFPLVGLPDCQSVGGEAGFDPPLRDPGITTDTIQQFGIPVPENYSAPSYSGLEEAASVHLQAFRIGEILFTVCACEQWADQSKNIKTRTDRIPENEWIGYDWSKQCTQKADGNWDCPRPGSSARLTVSDASFKKMRAQVQNDATGWDELVNVPFAESEPTDPTDPKFWGNYTHDDTPSKPALAAQNAQLGYALTVPIGMANDYNGYIPTYREYQRGDHYRKALAAWGPHASDYMSTRLVKIGRYLRRAGEAGAMGDPFPANVPGPNPIYDEWPGGGAKVAADLSFNDQRATTIGEFAAGGMQAYESSLPDDLAPAVVKQPEDVERFSGAFLTWVGGSNYTDQPRVRVQRFTGGAWTDYADQSGEVQVTLKFPPAEDVAAYRVRGSRFEWTAHFESFVSRFDLMDRPIATPPGSYRFVVEGERSQGGRPVRYSFNSREFLVKPWTGITVDSLGANDGVPGFKVGPRTTITKIPKVGGGEIEARIGPIDYPDSYKSPIKFIKANRTFVRDGAAPNDPDRFEWYCIPPRPDDDPTACSFRPWADVGDLARVVFTIVSASGKVERVSGSKVGGEWVASRKLKSGEGVYVEAGDACDAYGNYNGKASATVGNKDALPDKPPAGFSCVPKPAPGEVPGEGGGGSGGGGSGGGAGGSGGGVSGSNPLGLPSTKKCIDRRRFSFKIHQPPRRRIVAVNVFVNGKRKYSKRGTKITRITIKRLPSSTRLYRVRIVALTNRGDRVISDRRYRGCKKSRPTTRVEPRRGR